MTSFFFRFHSQTWPAARFDPQSLSVAKGRTFPCSSLIGSVQHRLSLKEWQGAGLNTPSGVKAQLATVEEGLVLKIIGAITAVDRQTLDERLRYLAVEVNATFGEAFGLAWKALIS